MTNLDKFVESNFSARDNFAIDKKTFKLIDCKLSLCTNCALFNNGCANIAEIKNWFEKPHISETDWSKVEIDTPVFVANDVNGHWVARRFAMYKDNKVYVFNYGVDSFTYNDETLHHTTPYKYARLATEEEVNNKKKIISSLQDYRI